MQCRSCGTEIAEKAIVCYRCGAGTTDPVRKAAPLKRRSAIPSLVGAALLVLLALYARTVAETAVDPEPWRMASIVLIGAALIVLVRGLLRRRGRRTPLR